MRLICGLFRLDGAPADPAIVTAMARAMTAPGLTPGLALRAQGVAALAVLDFDRAAAFDIPTADDGRWLAGDARPDRPAEAARALGVDAGASVDDLMLAALRRWDRETPDKLDGDFAAAAWDPGAERLLLARDAFGVRPLCWASVPEKAFVFASLPSGVLGSGLVEARADLGGLAQRLTQDLVETTCLAGVAWLPAASAMAVTRQGAEPAYRAWRPKVSSVGRWRGDRAEAQRRLRTLMEQAVEARVAGQGLVGADLSGGLDSSTIAILAARSARRRGRPIFAYSYLADPLSEVAERDETPFIRSVLDQEPNLIWSAHHTHAFRPDEITGGVDLLTTSLNEPSRSAHLDHARSDGVSLLLNGLGGDETASQQHDRLHLRMLRDGKGPEVLGDIVARARRVGVSPTRMAYRLLVLPLLPARLSGLWKHDGGRRPAAVGAVEVLTPEALALRRAARRWMIDAGPADRLERVVSGLMANRVNDLSVGAARYGLAVSFPMLDRRLVEFCLSLPAWLLTDQGYMRQPFRAAMQGVLPEVVRLRESKFPAMPDLLVKLVEARQALGVLIDRLRDEPAAGALLDFAAVDRALASILAAENSDPDRQAGTLNAVRALAVASRLVDLERGA